MAPHKAPRLRASHLLVLIIVSVLHSSLFPVTCAQEDYLQWYEVSNETALCSDYTKAGFFMSRNLNLSDPGSAKWVIFLESGSLCFSNDTCNRRFFEDSIRSKFSRGSSSFPTFGDFGPQTVWDATVNSSSPLPPMDVINPIMSSLQCLRNSTKYYPNGFQVSGRDILDRNPQLNKLFSGHNHVLLPYCSSDLWLGEEMDGPPCNCFDFNCFKYVPNSPNIQFTLRGKTIFQSAIRQLMRDHGMDSATEIVFVGTSAGGVGVANHVQWVREQISKDTSLLVIMDSSWFINFQDALYKTFDGAINQAQSLSQSQDSERLLQIIQSHPPCSDYTLEYPCCLSPHCLLTRTDNATGSPLYYPSDVRTFLISSIYDAYMLAPVAGQVYAESLEQAKASPRNLGSTQTAEDIVGTYFALSFLRVLAEYGGMMNATLIDAAKRAPNFSFYLPQCLQHGYLVTSTMWDSIPVSLRGNAGMDLALGAADFFHTNIPGRWTSNLLASTPSQTGTATYDLTIQDALLEWYLQTNTSSTRPYQYRAHCHGPYCYNHCPDSVIQTNIATNTWSPWTKSVIGLAIMAVAVICLYMKRVFDTWLLDLEKKQSEYLSTLERDETDHSLLEFPHCEESDAVSVSCLDIHYYVTTKAKTPVIDDQLSDTEPIVLGTIIEDVEDLDDTKALSGSESDGLGCPKSPTRQKRRRKRSRDSQFEPEVFDYLPSSKSSSLRRRRGQSTRNSSTSSNVLSRIPEEPNNNVLSRAASVEGEVTRNKKEILKGISLYFNPGEMIAIMGPSGSGKTTFLDLITARRKAGTISGDIFVNGIPVDEVRDWYVANTGYMLQLATPYYEELTVRENVTLATMMKMPKSFSLTEKFQRVEQVMEVTGLSLLADMVVGGTTGPGLSGGQKRRLAIALQLIKLPSVIFLDEPTSGLDATSSFELLTHLNKLALSNRTVILTIHQPRLEIFHMFNRLVLLAEGQVAYHGVPQKAYEVFVNALNSRYLEQGLVIPELETHNPADVIMDMLGNYKMRDILTEQYNLSNEPELVRSAITEARQKWEEQDMIDNPSTASACNGGASKIPQADFFTRLATHEARGAKSNQLVNFLPITFLIFGGGLGLVYLQQISPFLIVSGVCIFSTTSSIFMFNAIYPFYTKALEVYSYEKADGVGRAVDLILQGFIRFQAKAIVPVILSAAVNYLMLINASSYDFLVFLQVIVVNVALNQAWTAMFIMLVAASPQYCPYMVSAASAAFGFSAGFFIPMKQLGWWLRWIMFINPNYYVSSSTSVLLLADSTINQCASSDLSCFLQSGGQILRQFNFDKVNPYLHFVVLLSFTFVYLLLAVCFHWFRYTSIGNIRTLKKSLHRKKHLKTPVIEAAPSESVIEPIDNPTDTDPTSRELSDSEDEEPAEPSTPRTKSRRLWKYAIGKSMEESSESFSPYLNNGESHCVWIPKRVPKLAYVVRGIMREVKRKQASKPASPRKHSYKDVVLARRDSVRDHVEATRNYLRQYSSKLINVPESEPFFPLTQAHTQAADVDKQASPSKLKEGIQGPEEWISSGSPKRAAKYDTSETIMEKESSNDGAASM